MFPVDDMEGDQWNTTALGDDKRRLSEQLVKALRRQWAPGALLHYGQGKWYPGESLPRWALGCYWRHDGKPIWKDDRWIAQPDQDYGHGPSEALGFLEALADLLGVDRRYIKPGYEDVFHYLYKEHRLPVNVTPTDSKLADPEERDRLARTFERGLGAVVGYVLPLQHGSWKSGPWSFRGEHMFLLPGDSPAGLRLPLESLPWVDPKDFSYDHPLDPMADRGPLPDVHKHQEFLKGAAPPEAGQGRPHATRPL